MKKIFLPLVSLLVSCTTALEEPEYSGVSLEVDEGYKTCIVDCGMIGEADLGEGLFVRLMAESVDYKSVYVEFLQNDQNLGIPKYSLATQLDVGGADWFNLKVYFINKGSIYLWDKGGHEVTIGTLYNFDGSSWSAFDLNVSILKALPEWDAFGINDIRVANSYIEFDLREGEGYGGETDMTLKLKKKDLTPLL